jgi:putative ABC transport system substrate-binding protein
MQFDQLNRREFIGLLGGSVAAWPFGARAQERGRVYRLGCLLPTEPASSGWMAFLDELRLNGFIEGQNLTVIPGGLNIRRDQVDAKVDSIVKAGPDAIVSGPDYYTRAVQQATQSIPIIAMSEDMVLEGLVASFSRPGGNTTGISLLSPELDGKRQDLLIEGARDTSDRNTPGFHANGPSACKEIAGCGGGAWIEIDVFSVDAPDKVLSAIDAAKASGAGAITSWLRRYSP